jgi:endonuclease/exonuclease/phosphatase (EEP) superfamily protein YafD
VFDANVNVANGDVAGYAAEVRHDRPELVILQETTPTFLAALDATGAVADLPYRITAVRTDPFAAAMISRWPLTEDDIMANGGRPFLLRATVRVGETDVRIFGVHAVAAVAGDREGWIEDLRMVRRAVAVESRPVLVVGDFNATWNHRAFRALLDEGLTDAAAARGRPFQMTWPRDLGWVPPLTRIDHVLTTDGLVVTRIGVGEGRGSDHRPLIADVAVVQSSTR